MDFDDFSSTSSNSTPPLALFGDDHLHSSPDLSSGMASNEVESRSEKKTNTDDDDGESLNIPHRGSLRRIASARLSQTKTAFVIKVAADGPPPRKSQTKNGTHELLFDRQQYEFCTRLFALLDTERHFLIGPDCVRDFICLHCPVVRRRDDAIFALSRNEERVRERVESPTFTEIWERTLSSSISSCSTTAESKNGCSQSLPTDYRIGIEGWMVFVKLLALAHYQEASRRFASRHLQQMMRHKHRGVNPNPNEVYCVVGNPPPGPPSAISICDLVDVERERATSHGGFCPLPLLELDLDHCLVSSFSDNEKSSGFHHHQKGKISIEPFTGDFILRRRTNPVHVVRRSYSDFEWLHAILISQKRAGQGHLCGRIIPPLPSKQGSFPACQTIKTSGATSQNIAIKVITSMAKHFRGEYASGSTQQSTPRSSHRKGKVNMSAPKQSGSTEEAKASSIVAQRLERYLNYLWKNDAYSTSFVLKSFISASQSGLAAVKQIMQDHTHRKKRPVSNFDAVALRSGPHSAVSTVLSLISKKPHSALHLQDDTPWLQSAARVAVDGRLPVVLETTGHESISARLQIRSLPKFCNHRGSWDEEGTHAFEGASTMKIIPPSMSNQIPEFEVGAINIESELSDEENVGDYEMLPSPGPSNEHCVLNAIISKDQELQPSQSRFTYGTSAEQSNETDSVLGSIRVEDDIGKLGDIIRSVHCTLNKLHQASTFIHSSNTAKNASLLSLLKDIDSWGDGGGLSQCALIDGVATLDTFSNRIEQRNKAVIDGMSVVYPQLIGMGGGG